MARTARRSAVQPDRPSLASEVMPLAGRLFVVAGSGAVADESAALLEMLAADVVRVSRVTGGLTEVGAEGAIDATGELASGAPRFPVIRVEAAFDAERAWATSGAMALTGAASAPPAPLPSATLPARVTAAGAVVRLLAATTF